MPENQLSFSTLDFASKKKLTKRDLFLAGMAAVVPWAALEAVIDPFYPKMGPQGGRRAFPLATMLRIYCLQQWYQLSDPGAEEALYDIQSMRAFCGLDLGRDDIPDETTILNFRHLLERHDLTKAVFAAVKEHLEAKGALLRGGTIVDATLIAASPSTKNKEGKRDPEMRQSKKGNQWYFGMKVHIGTDAASGLVHTAGATAGSVHDAKVMDNLIREDDRAVYGDKAYACGWKKRAAKKAGVLWAVKEKAQAGKPLTRAQRAFNKKHGAVRAQEERRTGVLTPRTRKSLPRKAATGARVRRDPSHRTDKHAKTVLNGRNSCRSLNGHMVGQRFLSYQSGGPEEDSSRGRSESSSGLAQFGRRCGAYH